MLGSLYEGDETMAKGTRKIGRSAKTGRFTTVKKAQRYSSTHVVETIKKSNCSKPKKK